MNQKDDVSTGRFSTIVLIVLFGLVSAVGYLFAKSRSPRPLPPT